MRYDEVQKDWIWETRDGREILVTELHDYHLANIISLVQRQLERLEYATANPFDVETQAFDNFDDSFAEMRVMHATGLSVLQQEQRRRAQKLQGIQHPAVSHKLLAEPKAQPEN